MPFSTPWKRREPRQLMAVGIFYNAAALAVEIDGTRGDDTVTVERLTRGTSSDYDDWVKVIGTTEGEYKNAPTTTTARYFRLWPCGSVFGRVESA